MRRTPLAALLVSLVLAGCGGAPTDSLDPAPVGIATLERTAPQLPARGPFRSTGRGEFRWSVAAVTAERLGVSHRAGCPLAVSELRLLRLSHWGFDGRVRTGELVVHASQADAVVSVFRQLHAARFPVQRMQTIEQFGADDNASMAANNTSAYNCRTTTGGSSFSEHAFGTALDVNPAQNPYVRGTTVLPEAGRGFLDRSDVRAGMVVRSGTADGVVVRAFEAAGWGWGGDFSSIKDYQHFSLSGR